MARKPVRTVQVTISEDAAVLFEALRLFAGFADVSALLECHAEIGGMLVHGGHEEVTRGVVYDVLRAAVTAEYRTGHPLIWEAFQAGFGVLAGRMDGECRPGSVAAEYCREWNETYRQVVARLSSKTEGGGS